MILLDFKSSESDQVPTISSAVQSAIRELGDEIMWVILSDPDMSNKELKKMIPKQIRKSRNEILESNNSAYFLLGMYLQKGVPVQVFSDQSQELKEEFENVFEILSED